MLTEYILMVINFHMVKFKSYYLLVVNLYESKQVGIKVT